MFLFKNSNTEDEIKRATFSEKKTKHYFKKAYTEIQTQKHISKVCG